MAQITLTLPDGNARQYDAGITAGDVANDISKSLGKKAISATVDGAHYDLAWPINADASIAIHTMADEAQANELVRHDLAHIMARAVQELWPDTKVTIGPVIIAARGAAGGRRSADRSKIATKKPPESQASDGRNRRASASGAPSAGGNIVAATRAFFGFVTSSNRAKTSRVAPKAALGTLHDARPGVDRSRAQAGASTSVTRPACLASAEAQTASHSMGFKLHVE